MINMLSSGLPGGLRRWLFDTWSLALHPIWGEALTRPSTRFQAHLPPESDVVMTLPLSIVLPPQLTIGAAASAPLTLGLPAGAWLLILASIVPGLALTAYYTRKAKRLDAARARQSGEQGQ